MRAFRFGPVLVPALCLLSCGSPGGQDGGSGGGTGGGSGSGSLCTAVKSPPNLLQNASFECGTPDPDAWFARDGALAIVTSGAKDGQRAVQLTVPASGATDVTLAYAPDVATNLGQQMYCATVWMKGTVSDARLILRRVTGGAVDDFTFSSPIASERGWVRLPPSLILQAAGNGGDRLLLLAQSRNGRPGDTLVVDDADVWVSASGRCDEAR